MRLLVNKLRTWLGTGNITLESPVVPLNATIASAFRANFGITGSNAAVTSTDDLKAIETIALDLNQLRFLSTGTGLQAYQLVSGTDAEASPGILRPNDYAATTNEKIWLQIL